METNHGEPIDILEKIIKAYDSKNYEEVNNQDTLFNLSLIRKYGDQTNPERCEIDNIRQTFVLNTTGFPMKDNAIEEAREKYIALRNR